MTKNNQKYYREKLKPLLDVENEELSPVTALSVEIPNTFSRKSSTSSISSSSLSRALLFSRSKVQNIYLKVYLCLSGKAQNFSDEKKYIFIYVAVIIVVLIVIIF